jgi:hypothetical protein
MTRHLLRPILDIVRHSCVLELGSGVGFLGAVVACIQNGSPPSRLYLTDINAQVLERCQDNIRLRCSRFISHFALRFSGPRRCVNIHELDWFDVVISGFKDETPSQSFIRRIAPTVIIGADIVYSLHFSVFHLAQSDAGV